MKIQYFLLAALLVSGCDYSGDALLGRDRQAEIDYENSYQTCDVIQQFRDEVPSGCSEAEISRASMETEGDNGVILFTYGRPVGQDWINILSLTFQADEKKDGFQWSYEIVYNCGTPEDQPEDLRRVRCTALSAPRLRSAAVSGGGSAKFKQLKFENDCHATAVFELYSTQCLHGELPERNEFVAPTLGLVKP